MHTYILTGPMTRAEAPPGTWGVSGVRCGFLGFFAHGLLQRGLVLGCATRLRALRRRTGPIQIFEIYQVLQIQQVLLRQLRGQAC